MPTPKTMKELNAAYMAVAFNANVPDNAPEITAAFRDFETAAHRAGAYAEAQRDRADRVKEERETTDENRKILLNFADVHLSLCYSRDTLKALHAAATFDERERIRAEVQERAQKHRLQEDADETRRQEQIRESLKKQTELFEAEQRAKAAQEEEDRELDRQYKRSVIAQQQKANAIGTLATAQNIMTAEPLNRAFRTLNADCRAAVRACELARDSYAVAIVKGRPDALTAEWGRTAKAAEKDAEIKRVAVLPRIAAARQTVQDAGSFASKAAALAALDTIQSAVFCGHAFDDALSQVLIDAAYEIEAGAVTPAAKIGPDLRSKTARNRKGRIPATPAEKAADKEIVRQWKEYGKREAVENQNRRPTLAAFASTIGTTEKQVREALDRHATRQKRRGAVKAK